MTSSNTRPVDPKRGELWWVDLDPTKGSEIQKTRPVVVLSSDSLRALPLRLVVPVTGWKPHFSWRYSHVYLEPSKSNGLDKSSAADVLQLRAVAIERFENKIGIVNATQIAEIAAAVAAVVEYE